MAIIGSTGPVTGNSSTYGGGIWFGNRVFVSADFVLENVVYLMAQDRTSIDAVPAVYSDSGGALGTLLGTGPTVANCVIGVNTLPLTTPVALLSGTYVWIGNYQAGIGGLVAQAATDTASSYFIGSPPAPSTGPSLTTWASSNVIYGTGYAGSILAENTNTSQLDTLVVGQYVAQDARLSQVDVNAVAIYPSEFVNESQVATLLPVDIDNIARMAQEDVLVVGRGRIENNRVRCWPFSLDGHDCYVINLGGNETLVYDITTGQWAEWSSPDLNVWRAHTGQNWVSMGSVTYQNHFSNVVAGDDTFGVLWTLDPNAGYDIGPTSGNELPFIRQVVSGIPGSMRTVTPVNAVSLTGSMAKPQITGTGIQLETSDDNGATWQDQGTIDVEAGNYNQEWAWRSLGVVRSPGKLFRITDSGASVRFDNFEMR